MKDFTLTCNYVLNILQEMDSRYQRVDDLAKMNFTEKYREFVFKHNISPQDQFDSLEHLKRIALENGVEFSPQERASMLLARLDIKEKKLVLKANISRPGITSDYQSMREVLIAKWNTEVALHLHSEHRDNREAALEKALAAGKLYHRGEKRGENKGKEKGDGKQWKRGEKGEKGGSRGK